MDRDLFLRLLNTAIGPRTQRSFAALCDMTPQYLNRLLHSDTVTPTIDTLTKIANHALGGVKLSQLMDACGYDKSALQPAAAPGRDNHRRGLEIQMRIQPLRSPHVREQEVEYAEKIGNGYRQRDERVHVRGSVAQGAETGLEETAAAPEDDRRRQGPENEPLAGEIVEAHADEHDERRQHAGDDGVFLQGFVGVLPGYFGF